MTKYLAAVVVGLLLMGCGGGISPVPTSPGDFFRTFGPVLLCGLVCGLVVGLLNYFTRR